MVLSDFLSRQKTDDSNPHELIPISFSLRDKVSDYFYRIDNESNLPRKDKYLVQTRLQVRSTPNNTYFIQYERYFRKELPKHCEKHIYSTD